MSKLNLAALQNLAAIGGYGGLRQLSDGTVVTLLSAINVLLGRGWWQGAGYELTDEEYDEIDSLLSSASYELVQDVSGGGSVELITSQIYTAPTASAVVSWTPSTEYYMMECVFQGLRGGNSAYFTHGKLIFNEDVNAANYRAGYQWAEETAHVYYKAPTTNQYIHLYGVGYGASVPSDYSGCVSIRIFQTNRYNTRHTIQGILGSNMYTATSFSASIMSATYKSSALLWRITLIPDTSSYWYVGDTPYPPELSVKLYGYK